VDVRPSFLGGDGFVLAISGCPDTSGATAEDAAGTARLLAKSPMPIPPPNPPPPLGASAGRFASASFVSLPSEHD